MEGVVKRRAHLPAALTVAGLDPSGGAGILADLRGFSAASVWGTAALAALTVQSTRGLVSVHPVEPRLLAAELEELASDVPLRAMKTGALGSAKNARVVARFKQDRPELPLVVDPVMAPTRGLGARLDGRAALTATRELVALSTLVTPNLAEAAVLLGESAPISSSEARDAAVALLELGARAVLGKGGHGKGPWAEDWLAFASGRVVRVARPRLAVPPVHGAGCTLSALIAGRLAANASGPTEEAIVIAVRFARARIQSALVNASRLGGGLSVLPLTHR
jgi:hydroxymethylpyrimidine/phosphomethylpyrimidine kinase